MVGRLGSVCRLTHSSKDGKKEGEIKMTSVAYRNGNKLRDGDALTHQPSGVQYWYVGATDKKIIVRYKRTEYQFDPSEFLGLVEIRKH